MMLFVLIAFSASLSSDLESESNLRSKKNFGIFILVVLVLYLGLRPISFVFGDMGNYALDYSKYEKGGTLAVGKDYLFEKLMQFSSQFFPASFFFFVCILLYIIPLYVFSKKVFNDYWFYSFFILVLSFSFYAYGVNGIRNGIATSIFLMALSYKKKYYIIFWFVVAILLHKSMLIPALAYAITLFHKNHKNYLIAWSICIPLSLFLGNYFQNLFLSIGVFDQQRAIGYLSSDEKYLDQLDGVIVGFRWDFIIYSASGIFAGWYYIVKKKFIDPYYNRLFCIYISANAVWILVIQSNFSNRIAYLSWFMLGVIIIYPLLKDRIFTYQHKVIGRIIFFYFAFTFFMNVILAKT